MPRPYPPVSFEGIGEPARGLEALALPSSVEGEWPRFAVATRAARSVCCSQDDVCFVSADFFYWFSLSSFLGSLFVCSLVKCKLGPDGGKVLAKALETNGSVKELK